MRMADTAAILNCERVKAGDVFARVCFAMAMLSDFSGREGER